MKDDQLSPFLDGLEPPEPPPELRRVVLTRAKNALGQPPFRDRWARMWGNPILRLAWAACVVALLACHLVLSLQSRKPSITIAPSRFERDEVAATAGLQPLRLVARPLIGAAAMHGDDLVGSMYPGNQTQPQRE